MSTIDSESRPHGGGERLVEGQTPAERRSGMWTSIQPHLEIVR
jgi:hypothetical protein